MYVTINETCFFEIVGGQADHPNWLVISINFPLELVSVDRNHLWVDVRIYKSIFFICLLFCEFYNDR